MESIIITNPEELERKIKAMKKDGKDRLHVISDFDQTLTKSFIRGQKVPSVIAQIREGNYLGEEYVKKAFELHGIYYPIEIDSKIPIVEKNIKMFEWWTKHFDLLIKSGMNKSIIEDIVRKRKIPFRKGLPEFLKNLNENSIPIMIMTAGPGDIVLEALKFEKLNYPNLHIIGNLFIWDKNGKAIGVKEPIIHSLNKHEIEVKSHPIYSELLKRKNLILLGDLIEDIKMAEGFPYKCIIKIGFLNNINRLEEFRNNFDVILLNDLDMGYVKKLLNEIVS